MANAGQFLALVRTIAHSARACQEPIFETGRGAIALVAIPLPMFQRNSLDRLRPTAQD